MTSHQKLPQEQTPPRYKPYNGAAGGWGALRSVAKAFEMIIQQACRETVQAAGFDDEQIAVWEAAFAAARTYSRR